jgi:Zn-dependent protease
MDSNKIALGLVTYFGFLVALILREAAGAFAARALGDRSPNTDARATLNPVPHIDPFGTILFPLLMLISGIPLLFGWAKPFLPDTRYFKSAKRDCNLVYLSGPAANLGIALVCGAVFRFGGLGLVSDLATNPAPHFIRSIGVANLIIFVFNVLPVPNTDGWKILLNNINYNTARKLQDLAMPISIGFLLLLLMGGMRFVFAPVLGIYSALFGI